MARQYPDEDSEEIDDRDLPDEGEMDDSADADMVDCPRCGLEIWEQAERCPHCGIYVIEKESSRGRPLWFWIALIACLVMALIWAISPS